MSRESKVVPGEMVVKDSARGLVTAVFAALTPGLVDLHGDTYGPGAIRPVKSIPVSPWNHASMATGGPLPVGKADVVISGHQALARIEYFMDLERGREAFEVVRRLDGLEWSWGLDIRSHEPGTVDGHRVRVITDVVPLEVSPVMQAAGIGTHTVEARSASPEDLGRREWMRWQRRRFAAHLSHEIEVMTS